MIRLTAALLTLGIGVAVATTATAQGQSGCWWVGCNPEADLCRLLCGTDDPRSQYDSSQWQAPCAGIYPQQRPFHRHAKHHHTTAHYSG
jgi:hypothetical protein